MGWQKKNLGDVCNVIGGGTPSKKRQDFYSGNIPWATVRDMKSEQLTSTEFCITKEAVKDSSTNVIPADNVIIATRVGLGKVCMLAQETAINQDLRGVVPKNMKTLDVGFLFWWFKSVSATIVAEGTGATVQGVKLPFIKSLQIPLPPLPEQKRIVAILDESFAGIDAAVANTRQNLANARELFESYLNAVFTRKGEGWVEKKLSQVCEKITDGTHQTPKYFDSGFIFLSSKNVKEGVLDWENIKYIDEIQHIEMQKRLSPRLNDVLLRKNGAGYGKAALVDKDVTFDVYVSLAVLRPLEAILSEYLLHFINSPFAMKQFNARIKGAGVPNLHLQEIREVIISFPEDIAFQQQIIERIDHLLTETQRLETIYKQKLESLSDLKQSILQKAFAGELTSLPEKALEEAVA